MRNDSLVVSIITVCYNAADTIEKTIQSVIGQTYLNIEYIIVDGASTDNTLQIVSKYKEHIATIISEPDEGIYDAMNKGIIHANGDVIGIINADDWYESDAVEKVVKAITESDKDEDIIAGQANVIENEQVTLTTNRNKIDIIWKHMPFPHPATFVKRRTYQKYGLFNTEYKIAADYDFLMRLYVNGAQFNILPDILANFRMGGISTKAVVRSAIEKQQVLESYLEFCPYSEQVKKEGILRLDKVYLQECCERKPQKLVKYMDRCLGGLGAGIAIWGTGYWGKIFFNIFKENAIQVNCFVDNDCSKWSKTIQGIEVVPPSKIMQMNSKILIAVQEQGEAITQQIECNGEKGIKCVSLSQVIAYVKNGY